MKIDIQSVSKRYGQLWALKDLTLQVEASRCLALIGPSGGGKSTTLRLLAGLEKPDDGSLSINGNRLPIEENPLREYRKTIGVVFQAYNLFPHLDAVSNIALPLEVVHGLSPTEAHERAYALLERFQLTEHGAKKPAELSGGQNQRVAIARALAPRPEFLLFDEPTSALDPEMTAEVLDVIESLIQEGKRIIIVTHQMGFAKRAAETIALIANGCVEELAGAEELFSNPRSEVTQRFLAKALNY